MAVVDRLHVLSSGEFGPKTHKTSTYRSRSHWAVCLILLPLLRRDRALKAKLGLGPGKINSSARNLQPLTVSLSKRSNVIINVHGISVTQVPIIYIFSTVDCMKYKPTITKDCRAATAFSPAVLPFR